MKLKMLNVTHNVLVAIDLIFLSKKDAASLKHVNGGIYLAEIVGNCCFGRHYLRRAEILFNSKG